MCGISGVLALTGPLDANGLGLPHDTPTLSHRGPDDHGHYLGNRVFLGHRRLSIIDLKSGHQPMHTADGQCSIVYNGEVYNFRELRAELELLGHHFKTLSDTEVILAAYCQWGEGCVDRLRGMFVFAIWDERKQELFLARDRLGIKPLYYTVVDDTLFFGSELKSILCYRQVPRHMDPEAVAAYFMLTYIPAPLSIYQGIHKLEPGHTITVRNGQLHKREFWDFAFEPNHGRSAADTREELVERLREAVRIRMVSDVPIGAFLSGGVDSAAIVALMAGESDEPVNTFCMGFGGNIGGHMDERDYAREAAERYGTRHHDFEVVPEFDGLLEEIVRGFDEPFADSSSIPTYHVSRLTRQAATVALSGLGGDELFAGYERYLGMRLSSTYQYLPAALRKHVIRRVVDLIPERADGHYTINHLKRFVRSGDLPAARRYLGFTSLGTPEAMASLLTGGAVRAEHFDACMERMSATFENAPAEDALDRALYLDFKTYLPEDILACTDRMSMLHSLEVRVPFLDHPLVEFAATVPNSMKIKGFDKKHVLKEAVRGLIPDSIIDHRKQGFVGPMSQWLQGDLRPAIESVLGADRVRTAGLLDPDAVQGVMDQHYNRVEMNDKLIWTLAMYQLWSEHDSGLATAA